MAREAWIAMIQWCKGGVWEQVSADLHETKKDALRKAENKLRRHRKKYPDCRAAASAVRLPYRRGVMWPAGEGPLEAPRSWTKLRVRFETLDDGEKWEAFRDVHRMNLANRAEAVSAQRKAREYELAWRRVDQGQVGG